MVKGNGTRSHTGRRRASAGRNCRWGGAAQGRIVASTVTASHEQDPSQVPALLSQVEHRSDRFIGDGICDHALVYTAVEHHSPGARVISPPRKAAVLSSQVATAPTPRDAPLWAIESEGRCDWQRRSGSDTQRQAENVFSRFTRPFGTRLRALGRPKSYAASGQRGARDNCFFPSIRATPPPRSLFF